MSSASFASLVYNATYAAVRTCITASDNACVRLGLGTRLRCCLVWGWGGGYSWDTVPLKFCLGPEPGISGIFSSTFQSIFHFFFNLLKNEKLFGFKLFIYLFIFTAEPNKG